MGSRYPAVPLLITVLGGLALGVAFAMFPGVIALVLPSSLAVVLLLGVVVFLFSGQPRLRAWLTWWTIASFLLHLLVGALVTYSAAVTFFGPDALGYHRDASALADAWGGGATDVRVSRGKEGFFYTLAFLYRIFGPQMIVGLVMNAALAAALVPVMTDTTARIFGPRPTKIVPVLVTLLPGFLVWPSQLLREAAVLFLVAVTLNAAVRLARRLRPGSVIVFVVATALLLTFRPSVGLVVGGALAVALGFASRDALVGMSIQATTIILFVFIVAGAGLGYAGFALTTGSDLQDVDAFRSAVSKKADSGIASGTRLTSPADVARYLPVASARFLLGPFPWEIRSVPQAAALVDVVPWWMLLPSLLSGLVAAWRTLGRRTFLLLLPSAGLLLLLSLAAGNYGLLLRERTQFVLLLIPVIAFGAMRRHPWTSWRLANTPGVRQI